MDLHAFRRQVVRLKELGPSCDLLAGMPGLDRWPDQRGVDRRGLDLERETRRILGMIDSMTVLERSYPFLMTVPGRLREDRPRRRGRAVRGRPILRRIQGDERVRDGARAR